jgi:hypothetical protein
MKHCHCCNTTKPLDAFNNNASKKDGKQSRCIACRAVYRKENYEKIRASDKEYCKRNKEKVTASRAAWARNNKEKVSQYNRKWVAANKDKVREAAKAYQEAQPSKFRAYASKRRAKLLNALPSWVDTEKIKVIYEYRQLCSNVLGQVFHVDHIVPLQGKTVCGLHAPANLQVLTASENMSKKNKYWPDMWEPLDEIAGF